MATETKIALLIGLAFIVAFAFVLARQDEDADRRQDQQVAPPAQVATGNDVAHTDSDRVWQRRDGGDSLVQMIQSQPAAQGQQDAGADEANPDEVADGEPHAVNITDVDGQVPAVLSEPVPPVQLSLVQPTLPTQWYTVQPGDNLTGIACKFYGRANGVKWQLILDANPTRIPSPEGLRPRVRIIIPPLPGQTHAPSPSDVVPTLPVALPVPIAVAVKTYEVKVGDTLSSIASLHLGSANKYHKILELNRDLIRDANSIRPGMKLKLDFAVQTQVVLPSVTDESGGAYTPIPQQDSPAVSRPVVTPPVAVGRTYLVGPGDTLSGIASAKLGAASKWDDLLQWNRRVLTDPQQLRPGMRLRLTAPSHPVPAPVPVGEPVRAATATEGDGGETVG